MFEPLGQERLWPSLKIRLELPFFLLSYLTPALSIFHGDMHDDNIFIGLEGMQKNKRKKTQDQ